MIRKLLILFFLAGVTTPVIYIIWKINTVFYGFQSREMAQAQYTSKDVSGDLGGMKVVIPRHYAEFVQYDDPGPDGEPRIHSFGMDVRYPDMKGLEDWQTRREKRQQPLKENMWISVGVSAWRSYYGPESLNRLATTVLNPKEYTGLYYW